MIVSYCFLDSYTELFSLDVQLFPRHQNDDWYLSYVLIQNVSTGQVTYFPAHQWIRCDHGQPKRLILPAQSARDGRLKSNLVHFCCILKAMRTRWFFCFFVILSATAAEMWYALQHYNVTKFASPIWPVILFRFFHDVYNRTLSRQHSWSKLGYCGSIAAFNSAIDVSIIYAA